MEKRRLVLPRSRGFGLGSPFHETFADQSRSSQISGRCRPNRRRRSIGAKREGSTDPCRRRAVALRVAANRASFLIGPVTDEIVTTQQAVADRFHRLGLIPKPITVRDIVWRHTQS